MDNIIIKGGDCTPEINFNVNGRLLIKGRSYPEDASLIYNPLLDFVSAIETKKVVFEVNLDYINSGSVKYLKRILSNIEENEAIEQALIKWHHEKDDEKNKEIGYMFKEFFNKCRFEFK